MRGVRGCVTLSGIAMSDGRDRWVEGELDRLDVPPARPGFHDELWDRIQLVERVAARRWRRASIVLAVVALAATSAAGVLAFPRLERGGTTVVDRTYSCATAVSSGVGSVRLSAYVSITATRPGFVELQSGNKIVNHQVVPLLQLGTGKTPLAVDASLCRRTTRAVPLRASGLPSAGVFTASFLGGFDDDCIASGRVLVRARMTLSGGVATRAEVAVRNEKSGTPIAFLAWSTTRMPAYISARCKDHQ
jgi:hypothetical protein